MCDSERSAPLREYHYVLDGFVFRFKRALLSHNISKSKHIRLQAIKDVVKSEFRAYYEMCLYIVFTYMIYINLFYLQNTTRSTCFLTN